MKDYKEKYKFLIDSWVSDNEIINELTKLIFLDEYIDGDSYGVPGHPTIVSFLVAYIFLLKDKEIPNEKKWEDLRIEYERLKVYPETCLKKEFLK